MGRWQRGLILVLGALALLAGSLSPAAAERRVALVIGNASYSKSLAALKNPRNDASDVATALRELGFEVMFRPDMERRDVNTVLRDFDRLVRGADSALFYYAGHALEYRGEYYLAPTDATLEDGDALRYDMLPVDQVRDILAKASGVRLMIFDACRNDPLDPSGSFPPEAARAARDEALMRTVEGAGRHGMVVAYATAPQEVAEDGRARNSPFTRSLLRWLREAEMEVRPMFQRISRDTFDQTRGRQTPEITVALNEPYVLNRTESHHSVWLRIRQSSDPLDFRDFLARFPLSEYAPRAQRRLDMLERAEQLAERRKQEEAAQRRAAAERAEQARIAAERRRAVCADERGQVEALRAAGRRGELERLRVTSSCPEETGPLAETALGALAEQEARAERLRAATCAEEARRIRDADEAHASLDAFRGRLMCPENAGTLEAGLAAAAAREMAAKAAAAREAAAKEVAARESAARQAAREAAERETARQAAQDAAAREAAAKEAAAKEAAARQSAKEAAAREAAVKEAAARDAAAKEAAMKEAAARQAAKEFAAKESAAKDAAAKEAAAKDAAAREQAARDAAVRQAAKEAAAKEAAAKEDAAREAQAACAQEASAFAALDPDDAAPLQAFARTARCADVAAVARARVLRLEADRDRMEQACARDRGEFERLRGLGAEGQDQLARLGVATSCDALRPLVVAALGPASLAPERPAVNAPDQLRRARQALRQIGCLDRAGDDDSQDAIRDGLRRYNAARDLNGAGTDVDDATVRRLEAEGRRRVCPLACPAGEEARGDRCVAARPREREREAKPPRPAAPREAAPAKPAPKPTPPVAASAPPPAAKRSPSIILGN